MELMNDEIMQSFVEDSMEHLDAIESDLMDMEISSPEAPINEDLVNSIFRAAHSIKGGAGMLGLDDIKSLAHKLENALHMVRNRELAPLEQVVSTLLQGFDMLTKMIQSIGSDASFDVESMNSKLSTIMHDALPDEEKTSVDATTEASVDGRKLFVVDSLGLQLSLKGGKYLYILEYDLIHDIQRRDRTPLQVIKDLQDTGEIIDCRVDIASVGDLDSELTSAIPFYVLYATILDAQYTSTLCKLDENKVKPVTLEEVAEPAESPGGEVWEKSFGPFKLAGEEGDGLLRMPAAVDAEDHASLHEALLEALNHCERLKLDFTAMHQDSYLHVLEALCRAHVTFQRRGKTIQRLGDAPMAVKERMQRLGAPCQLCRNGEMECFLV